MKFISKVVFISCMVSVYAAPYGNNGSGKFSEACKAELMKVQNCISQKISKENIKTVCAAAQSAQCQQFYSNPMSFVPSCQNVNSLITTSADIFRNSVSVMCETNETGELCPFTEYEVTVGLTNIIKANKKKSQLAEQQMNEAVLNSIKKTCESPKCTEATKKYIRYLLDSNGSVTQTIAKNFKFSTLPTANKEVVDKLNLYLDILDGPNCITSTTNQPISSENNQPASSENNQPISSENNSELSNLVASNNNTITKDNTFNAQQKLSNNSEENSFAITRYTVMSFILYMVLYCGLFKYVIL
ncbi:hypothetical protein PIROE2DRAFT_11197 [Piromyces sp. E2]|nr:hypothetical protein PIROE2DRAFT_11197 [Piromyces sp. E2]|eukprot:OUM62505.1 hypothetical protein PIROE2DRAFT_11197 [Piromyces sp. E2]